MPGRKRKKTVALFATCLVDFWRPSVAEASARLIAGAGFRVSAPRGQTCCGQVNLNGGDLKGARALARRHIGLFEGFDYVVVPSGSCAGTVINQYPSLFEKGTELHGKAAKLAKKTFELTRFLARFGPKKAAQPNGKSLTWHDSCSCRRELGIRGEPRELLKRAGFEIAEAEARERCCGFGGLFAVKYGEISSHLAGEKCAALARPGANLIAGADLGCLLNIAGKLRAEGSDAEVRHIAEVLAGDDETPAIGGGKR